MADYSKTIIYKIINYDRPDLVYVGSTTNFTTRKYQHKTNSSNIDIKYKIMKTLEQLEVGNLGRWCKFVNIHVITKKKQKQKKIVI